MIAGVFALVALCPIDGADLLACITSVKIVHDIEKGCKVVFRLIGAVHAVIDGNEANAVLREGDLRIEAHTEIVTTHPAEVFTRTMPTLPASMSEIRRFQSGRSKADVR